MHPRRCDVTCFALTASVLLALLTPTAARATTVEPLALTETARRADAVLRVRVGSSAAGWEPFLGEQAVVTTVFFEKSDALKGEAVRALRLLGGRVGDYEQTVVGMPRLRAGDEAFVFVVTGREVVCPFVGGWQGVFLVRDGQVHRGGHPVVDIVGDEPARGQDNERGMDPDAFAEELRAAIARAARPEPADADHARRDEPPPPPTPEADRPPLLLEPIEVPAEVTPPAPTPLEPRDVTPTPPLHDVGELRSPTSRPSLPEAHGRPGRLGTLPGEGDLATPRPRTLRPASRLDRGADGGAPSPVLHSGDDTTPAPQETGTRRASRRPGDAASPEPRVVPGASVRARGDAASPGPGEMGSVPTFRGGGDGGSRRVRGPLFPPPRAVEGGR